jgi:hypothetical protein
MDMHNDETVLWLGSFGFVCTKRSPVRHHLILSLKTLTPFQEGFCSPFSLPHCHHHGDSGTDPYPAEGTDGCPSQDSPQVLFLLCFNISCVTLCGCIHETWDMSILCAIVSRRPSPPVFKWCPGTD